MRVLKSGPSPLLLPYLLYSYLVQNLAITFFFRYSWRQQAVFFFLFLSGNKNKVNLIMIITFF